MSSILVVDDDEDIVGLVAMRLGAEGHTIHTATSGGAALRVAREEHPDLMILDWMMPGIDGLEVCIEVRRDPSFATMPVMFLTAKAMEGDMIEAAEAGGNDYITKPFSPRELSNRVDALLERAQRWRTSPPRRSDYR
jgi:two-component system phosphate regulon response regulator PhoB